MNRRKFLSASLQTGLTAAVAGTAIAQGKDTNGNTAPRTGASSPPANMMGDEALSCYFTEERLHQALGTKELLKPTDVQVVAYNFPSWHPSKYMEGIFGKGWTEFDTLRNARTLFPGHSMPHYPLWGYFDEADPTWAAKEIETAAEYSVDAWMIDWYWHEGTQFYHEQIEQGLLKADNRSKLKFAIMWANHDWTNVYPAQSPAKAAVLLPQVHTLADFANVINYCAEHYFSQSNYLRIDDALVFSIFDIQKIITQLGTDGIKQAIDLMRERAARLGFAKLHLQAGNGCPKAHEKHLHELGLDSATTYGTLAYTYSSTPPGSRIAYGTGAYDAIASWKKNRENISVPFFPCCTVGWDDSARYGEYSSVAINRSPDQFERLMRAARHHVAADNHAKLIYVTAWNEWTEDQVLLPDSYWGYSYLEALRRAMKS